MAIRSLDIFEAGPNLGPINIPSSGAQGRWIGIKRYDGSNTTPLEGGGWVTDWYWMEPELAGDPSSGMGLGTGSGGGATGGGNSRGLPPNPKKGNGPNWSKKDGFFPGPPPDRCDEDAKKRIVDAYNRLINDAGWRKELEQFYDLWECLLSKWNEVAIDCDHRFGEEGEFSTFDPNKAKMNFTWETLADESKDELERLQRNDYLERRLLQQLVYMCGGNRLDAYAISSLNVKGGQHLLWIEVLRNKEVLTNGKDSYYDKDEGVYYGRWVFWDPEKGEISKFFNFKRIIPGLGLSQKAQEAARQWWRVR